MTDQNIPADKVRKIVNNMHRHAEHDTVCGTEEEYTRHFAALLEALLPSPPPPTLADMTTVERIACQWMQADVGDTDTPAVIVNPCWEEGSARVMWPTTRTVPVSWKNITPRPDLPSLEWPEATPTGPGHLAVGTVIESADDPRIAALPAGSALLDRDDDAVAKWGEMWAGDGYHPDPDEGDELGPWTVLHIPKEEA